MADVLFHSHFNTGYLSAINTLPYSYFCPFWQSSTPHTWNFKNSFIAVKFPCPLYCSLNLTTAEISWLPSPSSIRSLRVRYTPLMRINGLFLVEIRHCYCSSFSPTCLSTSSMQLVVSAQHSNIKWGTTHEEFEEHTNKWRIGKLNLTILWSFPPNGFGTKTLALGVLCVNLSLKHCKSPWTGLHVESIRQRAFQERSRVGLVGRIQWSSRF